MTTRPLSLDHLVYAVPNLDTAAADLENRLGIRAVPGGKHQGLGTHNALLGLGPSSYLELIAPDPDQPAPSGPRPFGVDRATTPRLVAWALTCTDIDAAIARSREHGYDPGDALPLERRTTTGETLRWRLTLNAMDGGPVPFLIDWGDTEHPARSAPQGLTLESFHVAHPEPQSLAPVLDALGTTVPVKQAEGPGLVAVVAGPRGVLMLD